MDLSAPTAVRESDQPALDHEIVALLPAPGEWSERDYLWLTSHTTRLVEFVDGYVEVLSMPTDGHQAILQALLYALHAMLSRVGGVVRCAPLRLRLRSGRFREPDLLALRAADDPRRGNEYWQGADLVVEIVSPDDPERDYVTKRTEYASLGIPEYWIIDPHREIVIVLRLIDGAYVEHGVFARGTTATSALFADFVVEVNGLLDAI